MDSDSRVEASFNKLLDKVCKLRHVMIDMVKSVNVILGTALEVFRQAYKVAEDSPELMLYNWNLANFYYANALFYSWWE